MKLNLFILTILFLTYNSIYSQNFRYGRVSKEEIQEKQHPIEADAHAAILYKEIKTTFDYSQDFGFTLHTEVFERIKIYTKEGFDWATKEVFLRKDGSRKMELKNEKATIYNLENGKVTSERLYKSNVFKTELHRYRDVVKMTMSDVKEGSVIEFSYVITSPFLQNIDDYEIQQQIPVNKIDFTFRAPEYYDYKVHQKGWLKIPVTTFKTNRLLHYRQTNSTFNKRSVNKASLSSNREVELTENNFAVKMDNIPAIIPEPNSISENYYKAAITFELSYIHFPGSTVENYTMTWDGVAKRIYEFPSFGNELRKSNYFSKDLEAIVAKSPDHNTKIINIYEFVKTKMHSNNYIGIASDKGVTEAYKDNSGSVADINMILTSMLNGAGVEAYPVLVSTKSNGIPLFPTINGFNYLIAAAKIGNNIILLDASDKFLTPNILNPEVINWQGRMVKKDGSSDWVSLYNTQEKALSNTMISAEITNDFNTTGSSRRMITGHYAYYYRDNYARVQIADVTKRLEALNKIEIADLEFQNFLNPYESLSESYTFEADNLIENIGEKLYFTPLLFHTEKENIYKSDERNYPIDYSYPWENRYTITVKLPENYKVESLPENINAIMPNNMGSFRFMISDQGHQIQISVQQNINESLIPTELYHDLKEFYQIMIDKLNEKIVLVKI